jgi:hypothetical protein
MVALYAVMFCLKSVEDERNRDMNGNTGMKEEHTRKMASDFSASNIVKN